MKRNLQKEKEIILKLNVIKNRLENSLIGKEKEISFMLACVAAEVPILLLGDPGTGKSFLVKKFSELVGSRGEDYFHYLLTQFTEPSELFGPLDMNKLMGENGVPIYSRVTDGKMPRATITFLDEVFKANSAILNTLLTITNEKRFYNNGEWKKVPLKVLITASNEMPETEELKAFVDRIPIRIHSTYLDLNCSNNPRNLERLIAVQMKNEIIEKSNQEGKEAEIAIDIKNLSEGIDSLVYVFSDKLEEILSNSRLSSSLKGLIEKIRERNKAGIFNCNLSDRKIISILKVAIARKLIETGNIDAKITFEDIKEVLCQTWDDLESEGGLKAEVRGYE